VTRCSDVADLDFRLSVEQAKQLAAIVAAPLGDRLNLLSRYQRQKGTAALIELFGSFIGLARTVVDNNREMVELILLLECVTTPHRSSDVNLPTLRGALLGVEHAALCAVDVCAGCAFRLGTPANQCETTALDVEYCIDEDRQRFMCHEDMDDHGEPLHLCRGYAAVIKLRDQTQERPASGSEAMA